MRLEWVTEWKLMRPSRRTAPDVGVGNGRDRDVGWNKHVQAPSRKCNLTGMRSYVNVACVRDAGWLLLWRLGDSEDAGVLLKVKWQEGGRAESKNRCALRCEKSNPRYFSSELCPNFSRHCLISKWNFFWLHGSSVLLTFSKKSEPIERGLSGKTRESCRKYRKRKKSSQEGTV